MSEPRVLLVHNAYRDRGGEERALEVHAHALEGAGVEHRVLVRHSAGTGRSRAARSLLRGGERPGEVAAAARALGANVVHVHNMQPLFGPRALRAARGAGARTVLHLHQFRLFCAIGVAFRDGEACFRCHHGRTLPGLALNCRGSVPEAVVYATALKRQLSEVIEAVDAFATPSRFAAAQLERLGLPGGSVRVIPNALPGAEVAEGSRADRGGYALIAGRLAREKGIDVAIRAAALSGVPLKVAGTGPLEAEVRELADRERAPVELLGHQSSEAMRELRAGAAMALMPSRGNEVMPYAVLEAMGAGLPVVAARGGALPEMVGEESCVPRGDAEALGEAMRELWEDPSRRVARGEAMLGLVREEHSEARLAERLLELYRSP